MTPKPNLADINYQQLISQHMRILKGLEYESGLFAASNKSVRTGYDKSWLRDNFYECIAFEHLGDWDTVRKTYQAILKIFLKHEKKIDHAIKAKPQANFEYIHARYHPETFDEYWEDWGNKQHDAIGAILFKIGEIEHQRKFSLLSDYNHRRIVQKLVDYLGSIQYWLDPDNGMWENEEELHASSVGACVAGLKSIQRHTAIEVPARLIEHGEKTLRALLPRESSHKFVDLAQLSLIYPYDVVTPQERRKILENVEYHLVKKHGVVRYRGDWYYNKNDDGHSEEAEWTFGFAWLSIIYNRLGEVEKAHHFLQESLSVLDPKGNMPELYYSNSDQYNENNPLGWAESLLVSALFLMNERAHQSPNNRPPQSKSTEKAPHPAQLPDTAKQEIEVVK